MSTRAPQFFTVPAGTRAVPCSSCDKPVYFVAMPSGKRMPIDCSVDGGRKPFAPVPGDGEPQDGSGVSHFATCPNAALHRRSR